MHICIHESDDINVHNCIHESGNDDDAGRNDEDGDASHCGFRHAEGKPTIWLCANFCENVLLETDITRPTQQHRKPATPFDSRQARL